MSANAGNEPRQVGRIEEAVLGLFTRKATVSEARMLGGRFREITLSGPELQRIAWLPGQKVQVSIGGWTQRTFTPFAWDSGAGSTKIVSYLHDQGPGARWARSAPIGESCWVFGPRHSIDLTALDRPALLFGDETSLGLAAALRSTQQGGSGVQVVLEADSAESVREASQLLAIDNVHVVERRAGDAHHAELQALLERLVREGGIHSCALSGKAGSLQKLGKRLRDLGVTSRGIRTKAYWAPGKVGLD